jgi:hypothetical protein
MGVLGLHLPAAFQVLVVLALLYVVLRSLGGGPPSTGKSPVTTNWRRRVVTPLKESDDCYRRVK